ncbi:MAG: TonB-dependent receptor [Acidobacteria bacterium]|nr:TonB-dependent receptor [Acidobacteriota bacterium]MCW5967623.1 TonB-dependent receptor [Blastocatellales bacterium]
MKIAPIFRRLAGLVVLLIATAAVAEAQFETATVLGTVRDTNGAVLPSAAVTLRNIATGTIATTTTDSEGNFQFLNVRIGQYKVSAELQGFATAVAENLTVTVNARQRVDLTMRAGAVTETVLITADAPLLETESSDRGQVISREQIVNLPLNGRSYADLALLAPGVRKSLLNNQGSGGRDASFNVNGLRSSLNNFTLDGIDNNSYGTSNQGFSNQVAQPSPDAVQEFKVQTNNFSAEFGRAGGAIINTSIRSGTNEIHGTLYNFLRNTSLNATGFFKPTRGQKPVLQQNQFGGTIGGPIIRDRTFFFADYEGFRRITRALSFATVPTLAQRQGNIGIPVRNPFTGVVYQNGIIPESDITPFARQVLNALVPPVTSAATNNYEDLPRSQFYNDKGDVKIDHNFNQKITGFIRVSHRKVNNFEAPTIPGPVFSAANAFVRVLNQQLAGAITYNVSNNSLFEFRLGISRTQAGKTPTGVGDTNFRLPGLPTDPRFAGGLNTQNISGFTALGRQSSNPQFQDPFVVNPRFNYSFILGKHSIKVGYEYQAINTEIDDFNPKYGQDNYSGQFSRPVGGANNNLYNLADFLFGARSGYQLNNNVIVNYRQRMHFGYIQDDFKVNQKLTVNVGMRYEFATPQWEKDNLLANFDPATRSLVRASNGSIYDRALVDPDRNNFAPRLGFAYRAMDKTVVRGGYGVSYIHFNRLGGENLLAFNGPNIVGSDIVQQVSQPLCTGNQFLNCFRPTMLGYPDGFVSSDRFNPLTARVNFTPRDTRTAYTQSWHLTIQRELPWNLLFDIGYVGNRTNKLIILADYNQARPNNANDPAAGTPLQDRRPINGFSFIQISFNGGYANYHALQTKIEKRFSGGLYLLNSFTWSKTIDNAAGHLEAASGDNSRTIITDLSYGRGIGSYDQPFNNTTSIVYDLPFGKGKMFGADVPTALDAVIGGWRMTLINTMTSGIPINLTYSPAAAFVVGSSLTYRPNQVQSELLSPSGSRGPDNYLNINAVVVPTDRSRPFGNVGRNTARAPSIYQADLGLHKAFPVWKEDVKLEFRMEAFNLLNKTNFLAPDSNANNIRRDGSGNAIAGGTYGVIRTAFPAREIQFALKLIF